jgi:Icc-related predicted phosphoesterase
MADNSSVNGNPVPMKNTDGNVVRVAAVGDVHCSEATAPALKSLFEQIARAADVLLLCGDLTDHGLPEEAKLLAVTLGAVRNVPTLAVLGNHDHEAGHVDEVNAILRGAGVQLLDGEAVEIHGVGIAGAKGFGGGFGRATLSAFGERATKAFVQEAINEAMKLEAALLRLRTPRRVAMLHYSPIAATVAGEPEVIFPFLGCSRLEEPLNRFAVSAAVHGHAHRGAPEGKTTGGVPVYNVALPLMRRAYADRPPFRILEIPLTPPAEPNVTEHPPVGEPVASSVS